MIASKLMAGAAMLVLGMAAARAAEVDAAKIVREGNAKGAAPCSSCHGLDGAGQAAAGFPRLAGLNADYLAKQLHDFKRGLRSNPIMQPMSQALSDAEITATARYYAALPVPKASEPAADPTLIKKGEALFQHGNWSKGVPGCYQCHGPEGQGIGAHFPGIVPQSSTYVRNQIRDWKSGSRRNDPAGLMKSVAEHLSDDEAAAVAAYLASRGAK